MKELAFVIASVLLLSACQDDPTPIPVDPDHPRGGCKYENQSGECVKYHDE